MPTGVWECASCGRRVLIKRIRCECGGQRWSPVSDSISGVVASWTEIHYGPVEFDIETPYIVLAVATEDSLVPVLSESPLEIGTKVQIEVQPVSLAGRPPGRRFRMQRVITSDLETAET